MPSYQLDPTDPLTPSDLVFLNGEQFAKKVMLGNFQLLHTDAKVSINQLAQVMLTTAFLAAEATGALRLEYQEKKALFGLRKAKSILANPATSLTEWPEKSLEGAFYSIARRFQQNGNNDIYTILYAWLREDTGNPWQKAIELAQAGMAERSVLEAHEEKKLKIFTITSYSLPKNMANLAKRGSVTSIQSLLEDYQNNHPDMWKLIGKQLKRAVRARTEQDDTDTFD